MHATAARGRGPLGGPGLRQRRQQTVTDWLLLVVVVVVVVVVMMNMMTMMMSMTNDDNDRADQQQLRLRQGERPQRPPGARAFTAMMSNPFGDHSTESQSGRHFVAYSQPTLHTKDAGLL